MLTHSKIYGTLTGLIIQSGRRDFVEELAVDPLSLFCDLKKSNCKFDPEVRDTQSAFLFLHLTSLLFPILVKTLNCFAW
jgi:hypothetical protein